MLLESYVEHTPSALVTPVLPGVLAISLREGAPPSDDQRLRENFI